ncbi:uncharacterized protein Z519_12391 [Cladophialophora bantiana CBS 173.52]|uniref:SNF2 N-terminal domain-containing protein n=1 Tax=Cladophialophora bantiana (strain ATCC 10958 / CBS 173.52 / CDC B-1940 / NIH 8579) TaxID=1442370 RepID=A0A0D2E9Z7_CLAB1|nr:uncharacterized protein Z519_12391 [Cladophialophora bantiana CBS 173.52]KIW86926.1 hypothetical protein Z519_12391 [Cladophialophora bantiana CBS 173.52]
MAERVLPEEYQSPMKRSIQRIEDEFWDLRAKIAVVSAPAPGYRTAARLLGISEDYNNLGPGIYVHPQHKDDPAKFVPKHHQVIGTAWQMQMEDSPLGGGILAADCGLGKTSQCYCLIYHAAMMKLRIWQQHLNHCEEAKTAGQPEPPAPKLDFRPTFVVAPPTALDSWYIEWLKHWCSAKEGKGLLNLRIFYGTDRTLSTNVDETLRQIMLPSDGKLARREIERAFPPNDPMSAFGVVWCAYETYAQRTLTSCKKSMEDKFRAAAGQPEKDEDSIATMPGDVNDVTDAQRLAFLPTLKEVELKEQDLRKIRKLT